MSRKIMILLFVLVSQIILADIPEWYKVGEIKDYPKSLYISAVAEGASLKEANASVQAFIASQIEVSIKSELDILTKSNIKDSSGRKDEHYEKKVEQKIKNSVNEILKGFEIIKSEKRGKTHYIFAVLNKKKYADDLKINMDKRYRGMIKLIKKADDDLESGDVLSAIENYENSQEEIDEFYEELSVYNLFAYEKYKIDSEIDINLDLKRKEIFREIAIVVLEGDNQKVKQGKRSDESIKVKIYYRNIAVPNFPIVFRYEEEKRELRAISNKSGLIEIEAIVYEARRNKGVIEIKTDLYKLPKRYRKYLKNIKNEIRYSIENRDKLELYLDVRDERGRELKSVVKNLERKFKQKNYIISKKSEKGIVIKIDSEDVKEISGFSGKNYIVNGNMDVTLKNRDGEERFLFSKRLKGMSMKSEKDAISNMYKNIKLSNRDISEIIIEAER